MSRNTWLGFAIFIMALSYSFLFIVDQDTIFRLTKEDGLYENLQVIFFLLTALFFFAGFLKYKNIFYALLGLLFFFAAGEEISWGQRIFQVPTPNFLENFNSQKEINLHNLSIFTKSVDNERAWSWAPILNFNRLFSLFWFTFCFLVPLLNIWNIAFSIFVRRLRLPIVPIKIGLLFPASYLVYKIMLVRFPNFAQPVTEVNEWILAFLFSIVSFSFLKNHLH